MSDRYPGGIITKNPATPTGPFETGAAPGIWTLEQQMQYKQQGVWPLAGNTVNYIEDVFSTYLYTGNGTSQTINNGINLSTKGGLLWIKDRGGLNWGHSLFDTARGAGNRLVSSTTAAQTTGYGQTFTSSGFDLDGSADYNWNGDTFVGWSFRKQAKFFDVVTWTGTGSNTTIAHSLGSVPGCIIVKRTDTTAAWAVYHRSLANTQYLVLNTVAAAATGATWWNSTTPTSSVFSVGTDASVNASGGTYVAYIFAHDAGGFGLSGTDNVITCGTFATDASSNATITLGYEPQWVFFKSSSTASQGWKILDNMRSFPTAISSGSDSRQLIPNSASGESGYGQVGPTATGWGTTIGQFGLASETYIYIAIRRGPMKVPTTGTSVFTPIARAGTGADAEVTGAGFPVDLVWIKDRTSAYGNQDYDRLRNAGFRLGTYGTFGDQINTTNGLSSFASMDGFSLGSDSTNIGVNRSGDNFINWCFRRAPGFFDVVCYTASAYTDLIYHNLGVAPEMIIAKNRGATATQWYIYHVGLGVGFEIYFNTNGKSSGYTWITTSTYWNNDSALYPLGEAHVSYLFATVAGVSKVGSYTGTGTTQTINCGFTAGSRFVLIKRTDSTGDWYVWDSARGIIAGNDPYLLINSTAVEVTGTDYIDTAATGFEISSTAPAAINANGGSFIFLAIA